MFDLTTKKEKMEMAAPEQRATYGNEVKFEMKKDELELSYFTYNLKYIFIRRSK